MMRRPWKIWIIRFRGRVRILQGTEVDAFLVGGVEAVVVGGGEVFSQESVGLGWCEAVGKEEFNGVVR